MTQRHTQKCPIAASLNIVGDHWTLMIVREALYGATRFKEFRKHTGIAKNMLAARLTTLVAEGILEKHDIGASGVRHEYRLTEKGRALVPMLAVLSQWGNEWIFGKGKEPFRLVNRKTGEAMASFTPQDAKGRSFSWEDVELVLEPGADKAMKARFARPVPSK
ncbi:MAG: helix-turn-helix transcriptional regulator [Robiginitomaculum sp.]|nr:helix-turn-helix transcriptional regulator [Robiginitomaculum sp.]